MMLRIQEFLTLTKKDKIKAISYAKKWLQPHIRTHGDEINSAMAVLAFVDPQYSPYGYLYAKSKWNAIILQFKQDSAFLYGLPVSAMLTVDFQAGLAVLKTE